MGDVVDFPTERGLIELEGETLGIMALDAAECDYDAAIVYLDEAKRWIDQRRLRIVIELQPPANDVHPGLVVETRGIYGRRLPAAFADEIMEALDGDFADASNLLADIADEIERRRAATSPQTITLSDARVTFAFPTDDDGPEAA